MAKDSFAQSFGAESVQLSILARRDRGVEDQKDERLVQRSSPSVNLVIDPTKGVVKTG